MAHAFTSDGFCQACGWNRVYADGVGCDEPEPNLNWSRNDPLPEPAQTLFRKLLIRMAADAP